MARYFPIDIHIQNITAKQFIFKPSSALTASEQC